MLAFASFHDGAGTALIPIKNAGSVVETLGYGPQYPRLRASWTAERGRKTLTEINATSRQRFQNTFYREGAAWLSSPIPQ
jgi:hypothetical protein